MATVVTAGQVPLPLGSVAAASIHRLRVPLLLIRPVSIDQASVITPSDAAPTIDPT
jgi:hypothetical protein